MADPFQWHDFETELLDELRRALRRVGRGRGKGPFYAVALYSIYRELDGPIYLPTLAAAAEPRSPAPDEEGFWGERWNPSDWSDFEIDLRKRQALRLERALIREATRGSVEQWRRVEARYLRTLVRLARALRDEGPSLLPVTSDFVAFVHDGEGGPALAAKTIPKRQFERLFAPQVAREAKLASTATRPPEERARFLVSRLDKFDGVDTETAQKELLAMGGSAVAALTAAVGNPKLGPTAARVLGEIDVPDPNAIAALRENAGKQLWYPMALGMLGDHEWLAAQSSNIAIVGLCARLKAIASRGRAHPLDYSLLERFLDSAEPAQRKAVERELEPGTSYVQIVASDAAEAVRGMQSPHAVIRWHAAAVARDRSLGVQVGRQLLPALAQCLSDRHGLVRRLAVLSISDWKAAAKPYRPAIEALRNDRDQTVRRIVEHVLNG